MNFYFRKLIAILGINSLFSCQCFQECLFGKNISTTTITSHIEGLHPNELDPETDVPDVQEPEPFIESFTGESIYAFDIANRNEVIHISGPIPESFIDGKTYCRVGEFPSKSLFQFKKDSEGNIGFQRVKEHNGNIIRCGSSIKDISDNGLWLFFNRPTNEHIKRLTLIMSQTASGYVECDSVNRIDLRQHLDDIISICRVNGAYVYINEPGKKSWIRLKGIKSIKIDLRRGVLEPSISAGQGITEVAFDDNNSQASFSGLDLLIVLDKDGNRFFSVAQKSDYHEIMYLYYVTLEEESNLKLATLEEAKSSFAVWKAKCEADGYRNIY